MSERRATRGGRLARLGSSRWWVVPGYLVALAVLYINGTPIALLPRWALVSHAVLLAVAVAGVLLRNRWPYLLPLAGLGGLLTGTAAVFMVGMMSLSMRRRGRSVGLVAAAGMVGAVAMYVERLQLQGSVHAGEAIVGVVVSAAVVVVAPMVAGSFVRTHRELEDSIAHRAELERVELELRAQQVVLTERERIASEMHDVLGHTLVLATMQAGALAVRSEDPATAHDAEQLRETTRRALTELRAVVHALGDHTRRDPTLDLDDVAGLVDASRDAGAQVGLAMPEPAELADVPPTIGRAVYLTVQEGLTNAHRHAPGQAVEIAMTITRESLPPRLRLTISNALAPGGNPGAGTGLAALTRRIEVLGGSLTARSARGAFVLAVTLPCEAA